MILAMMAVFIMGYAAIAFEHSIRINKAASALITGVACWTIYVFGSGQGQAPEELLHHLGELSQILFFLLGAMTIVELIDAHDGFDIITKRIKTTSKKKLLWIIGLLAFFLSAVLDNLTTSIVMISLARKLLADRKDRLLFAGAIILSANAGGVWSPIGDVTTTMLWIAGRISPFSIMAKLILPSLVCMVVPLLGLQLALRGQAERPQEEINGGTSPKEWQRKVVFFTGVAILLFVPVFKTVTHLPPFMGMLFGLGLLWVVVEILHSGKDEQDRKVYTVAYALRKIDTPSILFFLGILLAIAALQSAGLLNRLALGLDEKVGDPHAIAAFIGLLSPVVDNVPLVAASIGMYDLLHYPADHSFWTFLAYCTGTGGSILVIGSAAGVAVMGIEKMEFMWYLRRISWLALSGFAAGALVYLLQERLF